MTPDQWKAVLQATEGLTLPWQQKAMLKTEDLSLLRDLCRTVLQNFVTLRQAHLGLKVFIDRQRDLEAQQLLMDHPPREEEDLEDWGKRVFNDRKFGVILNDIQAYSDPLVRYMARGIAPLLVQAGLPTGGVGLLFFMGNYGFTPFGVHKENSGEEGFLFHIGPGEKTFYTWNKEDYRNIAGEEVVFPETDLMPTAKAHVMQPGDMMFIPSDVYHIAYTGEFSISLVLDYLNAPKERLQARLIQGLTEFTKEEKDHQPLPALPMDDLDQGIVQLTQAAPLHTAYKRAAQEYLMGLASHGGFYTPSRGDTFVEPVSPDQWWYITSPFTLYYYIHQDSCFLFVRGHRIRWAYSVALEQILKCWQAGKGVRLSDIPSSGEGESHAFQWFCHLQSIGGIERRLSKDQLHLSENF